VALKRRLERDREARVHDVSLTYITGRGPWYQVSWKGSVERSGGLSTNIGIHFFDVLLWLFGEVTDCAVHASDPQIMAGHLTMKRARVRWLLSTDIARLPFNPESGRSMTYRSMSVDGEEVEFSTGFEDLHTRLYEETLAGRGFGIEDSRPSIELAHRIRHTVTTAAGGLAHPMLER
jgi:UDP-N-acetyl-2-amino-2-deoxyglucuronate dehydrogenase